MALTKGHKELLEEISTIRELLALDHENIDQYSQKANRLRLIKEQMIRARVILWYSWVDETLDYTISNYFFYNHRRTGRLNWNSKKYSNFKHYVLEKMYLPQKIELAVKVKRRWKKHEGNIWKLNTLRNALAHSFFPEQRPQKPEYKKKDIFSLAGIAALEEDMQALNKERELLL